VQRVGWGTLRLLHLHCGQGSMVDVAADIHEVLVLSIDG
jgi:hypothetical protein